MSKESFLASTNAPSSLAERAWDRADGDEQEATKLVEPQEVWVKGRFLVQSQNYDGGFLICWNVQDEVPTPIKLVVTSNSEEIQDLTVKNDHEKFKAEIKTLNQSSNRMGGTSDQAHEAVKSAWQDSSSSIRSAVEQGQYGQLASLHEDVIQSSLGVNEVNADVDVDVVRGIDQAGPADDGAADEGSQSSPEPGGVTLQCEGEINPVRGVPVNKLQTGDKVFAEITSYPDEHKNLKSAINNQRDDETGLIPAKITSRRSTAAGTTELQVQFGKDVHGTMRVGNDVNILVPDSTRYSRSGSGNSDELAVFLEENWVWFVGGGVVILLLVLLAFLIF